VPPLATVERGADRCQNAVGELVLSTYSVEKLGSCELEIFSMNQIAAENQP
jgi:hypothetical protein